MHASELLGAFEEKGLHVFTINDIIRLTGKGKGYARLLASRLVAKGMVSRASRGIYYTGRATLFEVASNIAFPSYISLLSAFSYYGFVSQVLSMVDVITLKRRGDASFENAKIHFITIRKERFFGFHRDNANIFVAEPEKAFVDALYLGMPQYGYIEEAYARAEMAKKVSREKLLDYASRMHVKALEERAEGLLLRIDAARLKEEAQRMRGQR